MFFCDFGVCHIPETKRKRYSVLSNQKALFQPASTFGWKPRDEKMDFPFDVFSLACAICYTLIKCRRPFGDTVVARVSNIEKNWILVTPGLLVEVVGEVAEIFKMLQTMLNAKSHDPQFHKFWNTPSSTNPHQRESIVSSVLGILKVTVTACNYLLAAHSITFFPFQKCLPLKGLSRKCQKLQRLLLHKVQKNQSVCR